jgi:hypothetical protein
VKLKLEKLSKSSGPPTFYKAQVFKFGNGWLASCQEGCGGVKYVPQASQALMFKIAESHMKKVHADGIYIKSLINGR